MTTIVIMPGGFHPYHAGHHALYQSAQRTFPNAKVYVAATNDTSSRPFPFAVKEKLAKLAGVEAGHFVQVKSPFRAEEITSKFDPQKDVLIFVRSEKDANSPPQPGGVKRDGSPSYLQPLLGAKQLEPFSKHAYMAYLPTVEFGPGMTSATQIRSAWPTLNEKRKTALVMSLYPRTQTNLKLAQTVVKLLDAAIGGEPGVTEDSIDHRIAYAKKNNPLQASVRQHEYGYTALVTDANTGKPSWFGGAVWQTPELAMGHAKAFVKGFPYLEQRFAQRFVDKNRDGIAEPDMTEGIMSKIANKVMGAAPEQPKYKVGQRVKYETSPHQPDWADGGSGVGVITDYKNGHYMINGNPVNHFEIKGVAAEVSTPNKGDAVYYGKRLVGWFKGYSEHGKIITEPNYEEMGDEYANRDVYWDPQDKITIKPEQGVAEGVSLKQKHEDKKRADQNQVRYGKMTQAEFDKKWTRTERPNPTDKKQGVAEGAPIVVAQSPIDVRNPKKAPQPYRNQGDIVPPTNPPSTEKRGVKGRPGQRPMPDYTKDVDENQNSDYLDELKCWPGYSRVPGIAAGAPGSCKKKSK